MIFSLRKWRERFKFILLFLALTFLFHHLLACITDYFQPRHRFEEPSGGAVKAYVWERGGPEKGSALDRLRFFYWYGE